MNLCNKQILQKNLNYYKKQCVSQLRWPPGNKHNIQNRKAQSVNLWEFKANINWL